MVIESEWIASMIFGLRSNSIGQCWLNLIIHVLKFALMEVPLVTPDPILLPNIGKFRSSPRWLRGNRPAAGDGVQERLERVGKGFDALFFQFLGYLGHRNAQHFQFGKDMVSSVQVRLNFQLGPAVVAEGIQGGQGICCRVGGSA